MERIPTNFTSEDLDTALARILSEPSWACRLLCATAAALEEQPFLVLNPHLLTCALNAGMEQALAGLPEVVTERAAQSAIDALPHTYPAQTAGEYAVAIRDAARAV